MHTKQQKTKNTMPIDSIRTYNHSYKPPGDSVGVPACFSEPYLGQRWPIAARLPAGGYWRGLRDYTGGQCIRWTANHIDLFVDSITVL